MPVATPSRAAADPRAIARRARAAGLLEPGDRVLVAVSGGADSVALAGLLAAAGEHGLSLTLTLAHLDHGWRGPAEARLDRAVVEALASRLGLPLACAGPPDPPAQGEDAARRWRYAALARIAHAHGATKVALAHHLGDQAETFLLRLLRGSGLWGLTGIPAARALDHGRLTVVRPLLEVHPEALRAWNRERGHAWREDPTNAGPGDRNEVRRRLAALAAARADAPEHLAALAARLGRRVERRVRALEERLVAASVPHGPGTAVEVPRRLLVGLAGEDLGLALRVLGRSLGADAHGPWLTRRHVALVAGAVEHGGDVHLPRGLALRRSPSRVWLYRRGPRPPDPLDLARVDVPRAGLSLEALRRAPAPFTAALDAEVLGEAARLRPLEPGDRFTPLGLEASGPVDVRRWLARRGVPLAVRSQAWVVEGARGVAWVVGERIDAGHAVGPATRRVARLEVGPRR